MKFTKLVNYSIFLSAFVLSGCMSVLPPKPIIKTVYIGGECPTFNKNITLHIKKLDTERATITWQDVQSLKDLGAAKKVFNEEVIKMNKENQKKMDVILQDTK